MPRLSVWMVRAALLNLGIGFTLGGLLLFHKGMPLDGDVWRLWPWHIELALVGWIIQLAMGVAFWILPRFSRGERFGNIRLAWIAFFLLNLGILAAGAGQWFRSANELAALGRGLELLAVVAFAAHLWPRVKPPGA